jgi:HD-GYP domain-containing protein (c-di-GMP phosphodiesterase class II)
MTSPRVYQPAMPVQQALAELAKGAGSQFDPKLIDLFVKLVLDDPVLAGHTIRS